MHSQLETIGMLPLGLLVLQCLLCDLPIRLHAFPPDAQPYRTGFHFQPLKNWMNDPNGLMFYNGYYHLFFQWNPDAPVWVPNVTWGHAISKNMVDWHIFAEPALLPDQWYDRSGCWSGSATRLSNGTPVLLYTGLTFSEERKQVQVQAMAVPTILVQDPFLERWTKIPQNPILAAPSGIDSSKFRDPTTAWKGPDGVWRLIVGSKSNHGGIALVYRSSDFINWEMMEKPMLHGSPRAGMWECPDFYPVTANASRMGLDTSAYGPYVLHVLKASFYDILQDHYVVGTYDAVSDSFEPVNADYDVGVSSFMYDYGKYYASKTFYDSSKDRRILMGWVNESTTIEADIARGWASLQAVPRVVWLDERDKNRVLQWPIEETEILRRKKAGFKNLGLEKAAVVKINGIKGAQLDIEVDFTLPDLKQAEKGMDVDWSNARALCSEQELSVLGGVGPFGLFVLASDDRVERTSVFFYVVSSESGLKALVCSDQSRSTLAVDVDKANYGSFIPLLAEEKTLSLRVLVDHSIVESFAQGGKVCITSRVYPTMAIGEEAHLFVFNDGSVAIQVKRLAAWEMESAVVGGAAVCAHDCVRDTVGCELDASNLSRSYG